MSYSLAAAVAARVSDRRPRAAVLAAGTTAALGCVGVATTASPGWFVVLVFVGGTGAGLASPALVRLVDAVTPPHAAATAQSLVNTGTAVGVVVAGALALAVPSTAGAWWTMAALNALAAGGVLLLVRGPRRGRRAQDRIGQRDVVRLASPRDAGGRGGGRRCRLGAPVVLRPAHRDRVGAGRRRQRRVPVDRARGWADSWAR